MFENRLERGALVGRQLHHHRRRFTPEKRSLEQPGEAEGRARPVLFASAPLLRARGRTSVTGRPLARARHEAFIKEPTTRIEVTLATPSALLVAVGVSLGLAILRSL